MNMKEIKQLANRMIKDNINILIKGFNFFCAQIRNSPRSFLWYKFVLYKHFDLRVFTFLWQFKLKKSNFLVKEMLKLAWFALIL